MSRNNRFTFKPGLPPGALPESDKKKQKKSRITLFDYDSDNFLEKEIEEIEATLEFIKKPSITWINIDSIEDIELIEKIGKIFEIHPLVLEDIVNTTQRPKIEEFENYLFVVMKMIYLSNENSDDYEIDTEQISLIIGDNFVISFQEKIGDVFDPIRERIRKNKGRLRKAGSDYLSYALIDCITDNYFIILESAGKLLEDIEEELITEPTTETLQNIHKLKSKMVNLRKSVWYLREIISKLERGDLKFIQDSSKIYFRDVYDHIIQVMDIVETSRERLSSMIEIYLSSVSNRMNEVMKVLTIIATIFIPLTFIAGIYGMNFDFMPELNWRGGYFVVLFVMLLVAGGMIYYFKKKKWL